MMIIFIPVSFNSSLCSVLKMKRSSDAMSSTSSRVIRRVAKKSRPSWKRLRMSRLPSLNVHHFKRYGTTETLEMTGPELNLAATFDFSKIINYTEFTALYDRFCIDKVVLCIKMISNPNSVAYANVAGGGTIATTLVNNANIYPVMIYCPDYDNANTETYQQLKERTRSKMVVLQPNKFHYFSVRPAVSNTYYGVGIASAYGPKWSQWIDESNAQTPHYGMKIAITTPVLDPTNDYPYRFHLESCYYFRCRDVK